MVLKSLIICAIISGFSALPFTLNLTTDQIIGVWMTGEGKGKIKIEKVGSKYFGRIVWLQTPNYPNGQPKIDKNNPDPSKRKNPVMGLLILKNFVFEDGVWEDGTIYDPESGKEYSCTISMSNKNALNVRGYIGISLIGKTQTWMRSE